MRNVVITGVGIKSCIGNDYAEVLANLQNAKSGIVFNEKYSEMGFRSCVSGSVNIDLSEYIDRKLLRFMGESAGYAYLATKDALKMAGIDESHLDSPKIGIVAGSGGASTRVMLESGDIAREKGPKRIGPYGVTKSMSSSISAIIATALKLKGINYSISSACATSAHCIGHAADLIVKNGGTAILAETPEIYGAEHMLTRRAISPEVGKKLVDRILWWEDYVTRNKGSLNNNPSPGNKAGGLTTILEKSLGAAAKGGTTPLNDVLLYAQQAEKKGFLFMDSPGYDPASVTGQIASGCNVVTFTTGRGSCFGCKPSPSIKIATNTEMYNNMIEDMDVNAGKVISDNKSIEDVGQEIFDLIVRVASGEKSKSETQGLGDLEFVPWQIGATM